MSTDTRDDRAIRAIACPRCGAPAGKQCTWRQPQDGRHGTIARPSCCLERRKANQARLRDLELVSGSPSRVSTVVDLSAVATGDLKWKNLDERRELRRRHKKEKVR